MSPNAAYVTLLTKASYLPGALVVEHCLRSVKSQYPFIVMITPTVPQEARDVLQKKGIITKEVDFLHPEEGTHKLADHDSRFGDTWTKLRYVVDAVIRTNLFDCERRGFDLYEYDVRSQIDRQSHFQIDTVTSGLCSWILT